MSRIARKEGEITRKQPHLNGASASCGNHVVQPTFLDDRQVHHSPTLRVLAFAEALMETPDKETADKIARIQRVRDLVEQYDQGGFGRDLAGLRSEINKEVHWARQEVIEAGCYQSYTISPPPMVGGVIAQRVDAFASMFSPPWGKNLFGEVVDMLDRTIGVLSTAPRKVKTEPVIAKVREKYAFVAMQIDPDRHELADLLDAIKEAAGRCGIQAERIDEDLSNKRITDRILHSISVAEHVIVDLTDERPNVFFEAGYAHGLGKTPIYIAKHGTKLHFDLKDYPVIFYRSFKELREQLEARLRAASPV
jgi:hypothetical protein